MDMNVKYVLPVVLSLAISGCTATKQPPVGSVPTANAGQVVNKQSVPELPPVCSLPGGIAGQVDDKHSVIGIALGQPLAIAECKKEYIFGGPTVRYIPLQSNVCFVENIINVLATCSTLKDKTIFIEYPRVPPKLKPVWARSVSVKLLNGNVEMVSFFTLGIQGQDLVYIDLVKKYGKPTKKNVSQIQNLNGAKFESITAMWDKGDVFVEFDGTTDELTSGEVRIYSAVGKASSDAKRKEYLDSFKSL